ncbi:Casein kinase II subunit beta [Nosema granulosis]|uniref:Casein kinase II subunit beta n=1 Tax=Nosema granulosis TaxID=83296 RepID=A0A9P6H1N8_9MICR|nr:Casein kinase II subunit beta [Nosema granulosis]
MDEKCKMYELEDSEENDATYWAGEFFKKKENTFLARIDDSFIEDSFNLVGLNKKVDNLKKSYNAIIDKTKSQDYIEESCLYYLLHQRYIYSMSGLEAILEKVMNKEYGTCSRLGCSAKLIPVGESNEPRVSPTRLFCHVCSCLYMPKGPIKALDGCAWGTSFPMFLIITFPYKFKQKNNTPYVPRLFGFRVCPQDNFDSLEDE